jgi:Chaperone of endosialidase
MKRIALVTMISTFLLQTSVFSQPPELINYQGRLLNGTNLVNGNVGLALRLYNVASGGSILFEDSNTVAVVDGLYSTFIGDDVNTELASYQPLTAVLTNTAVYVEPEVNGTVLSPRERVVSVAYALRAGSGSSAIQPPIDITYSNYPDSVLRIANNGGGPAIWAEATNASALFAVNWGDGNALFAANAGGGPSAIFQGGNVGIGTQTPGEKLSVNGRVYSTFGGFRFPDGSVQETAAANWLQNEAGDIYYMQGNVGIGADSPSGTLHLARAYPDAVSTLYQTDRIIEDAPTKLTNFNTTVNAAGSGAGGTWTALGNILNSDNVRAASTFANNGYQFAAQSLYVTNLGINIPTNAFGLSMTVTLEGFHTSAPNCNGSVIAAFRAVSNGVPGSSLASVYLESTEQSFVVNSFFGWGMALTPQLVTNSSFGVIIDLSGHYGNCVPSFPTTAYIDQVRVAIQYYVAITNGDLQKISYVMGIPQNSKSFVIRPGTLLTSNGVNGIRIETNGNVFINILNPSDRNLKDNFTPVNVDDVLEKVADLPMTTWKFKEDPSVLHLGPMAQDFHAAFGLGPNDTSIAIVDANGVALAAIQALAKEKSRLEEKVSVFGDRVSELEKENEQLQQELEAIKQKIGM